MSNQSTIPFTAHRLFFTLQARDTVVLHAHTGSALRGMFYRAMMALAGPVRDAGSGEMQFLPNDPVRYLLSTFDDESQRGQDIPRPYTVEPIHSLQPRGVDDQHVEDMAFNPGESFTFGLTLYARAMELFPYVILAMKRAETMGLGVGRGRFVVSRVYCAHPLTNETQEVYAEGDQLVSVPDLMVTQDDIMRAPSPSGHTLALEFLTPTTLRSDGEITPKPVFNVILHRLIERLTELTTHFAGDILPCLPTTREQKNALLRQADMVSVAYDGTRWVHLSGYSARRQERTNLSGFMGAAVFECEDFTPFLPLLRWGEVVHIGKHTVKGNGLYRIATPAASA
jgi:CRISPR-associated endoribonuclease Cas6